jgi:preprotein translocase subunit SecD
MAVALVVGLLYTLPNLFGEAPAVQVSSGKNTLRLDSGTARRVDDLLKTAAVASDGTAVFDGRSVRVRFKDPDTQLKARDVLQRALNPDANDPSYVVALNLQSRSPAWLAQINALPMYLGLDLRGGVHFLMQVDMKTALTKKADAIAGDARTLLREKNIRHGGANRVGNTVEIKFRDADTRAAGQRGLQDQMQDVNFAESSEGADYKLTLSLKPELERNVQDSALKQNISTLSNRINELGVAEPVIQQQGADRIVVQLPGVQDTARAKDILGRTATLEFRMVDESAEANAVASGGAVPFGAEKFNARDGRTVVLRKQVVLTGDSLTDAQPGFDQQTQEPLVSLTVDAKGGRIMRDISRENIGKRMAIVLFEKGKGELLTDPVIRGELGNRFQISGRMNTQEANDLALLLRAGALAAPMEIIEERTIGPSMGAENIEKGLSSVTWGFLVVIGFMVIYYMVFGAISAVALGVNLLLLVAVLSMLQATLTLPGIAAIALTLGMAIDANVLINERVREELRNGLSPQAAIAKGYDNAWATILDSNITTLIAGLALLIFGSGPVRGFAVVHCLGILTSMFSAVFFSRGLVNLWYGGRKKLQTVSIGTVWRPGNETAADKLQAAEAIAAEARAPGKTK